jgi:hypothetical protein
LLVLTYLCLVLPLDAAAPEFKRVFASLSQFEPNLGQSPASVPFTAQASGFRLLLEQGAVVFDFGNRQARIELGRNRSSV